MTINKIDETKTNHTADSLIKKIADGSVITPKGFQATGLHTGVKRKRKDLGVIYSETPAQAAAVYTLNKVQAAPIKVTQSSLSQDYITQAVVVNSGNANACTGEQGIQDAIEIQKLAAEHFNIPKHHVAVASTGVIGVNMPMDKISPNIVKLETGNSNEDVKSFEEAILTTDTFKKSACYQTIIDNQTITIGGAAKGSGMIEPNMGTMLAFITTDANIDSTHLNPLLKKVIDRTFNSITVDGDTSTNDMVLVMANQAAKNNSLTPDHPEWLKFEMLLEKVCESLAKQIARDGEGATKLIEVQVEGAASDTDAQKVAKTIVGSSLVKTAVFGKDANWGRIICAIGYSDAAINPDTVDIWNGPIQFLNKSEPMDFSETEAVEYLSNDEICIKVNLNNGTGKGKAWGCDLTYDYVRINASYRS